LSKITKSKLDFSFLLAIIKQNKNTKIIYGLLGEKTMKIYCLEFHYKRDILSIFRILKNRGYKAKDFELKYLPEKIGKRFSNPKGIFAKAVYQKKDSEICIYMEYSSPRAFILEDTECKNTSELEILFKNLAQNKEGSLHISFLC